MYYPSSFLLLFQELCHQFRSNNSNNNNDTTDNNLPAYNSRQHQQQCQQQQQRRRRRPLLLLLLVGGGLIIGAFFSILLFVHSFSVQVVPSSSSSRSSCLPSKSSNPFIQTTPSSVGSSTTTKIASMSSSSSFPSEDETDQHQEEEEETVATTTHKVIASSSASSLAPLPLLEWKPLGSSNFSNSSSIRSSSVGNNTIVLENESGTKDGTDCRYAKDENYLNAVVDVWRQLEEEQQQQHHHHQQQQHNFGAEIAPWIYHDEDGTPLYGHIVRPTKSKSTTTENTNTTTRHRRRRLPGLFLFHTAAGPQDIFLLYKAAQLVTSKKLGGGRKHDDDDDNDDEDEAAADGGGCIVFICDVISDQTGWAWGSDRGRFNTITQQLLANGAQLLRARVQAALTNGLLLFHDDNNENDGQIVDLRVDPHRLACLGWCFGAHPILEVVTLQQQQQQQPGTSTSTTAFSVPALISYHGVYHRKEDQEKDVNDDNDMSPPPPPPEQQPPPPQDGEILICTGNSDPFVSREDVEDATRTMRQSNYYHVVTVLDFENTKHGFTNPAQDWNPNPAFEYNDEAATQSWEATMELLQRKLL